MTDKEIIIDGVDVSECDRYIANDGYMGIYKTPVFKGDCKLSHIGKCQGSECLFKRFKYKEQECEELKREIAFGNNGELSDKIRAIVFKDLNAENSKYKQALDNVEKMCKDHPFCDCSCGQDILDIINETKKG